MPYTEALLTILPSERALLTIVPSQRVLFDLLHHHADASHASLTFETCMTMPMPNSCIVSKRYIVAFYEHLLWLNSTSCIIRQQPYLLLSNRTGVSIIMENFFPSVRNMLPSIFDLGQHIRNFGSKVFNNDLSASQYLYNDIQKLSFTYHIYLRHTSIT